MLDSQKLVGSGPGQPVQPVLWLRLRMDNNVNPGNAKVFRSK